MPERIVIYEIYSNDAADMTYKIRVGNLFMQDGKQNHI